MSKQPNNSKKRPTAKPKNCGTRKKSKPSTNSECIIPPRVPDSVLNRFTLGRNENEAKRISDYVEWQCRKDDEKVTYLERVMTEAIYGTRYECWNVRTSKSRYWVITNPTNLYSQDLFPSVDYTLSFHVGLMARVQARHRATTDSKLADRLASAVRRWEQAAAALDQCQESEEVQAVGMRCRECLVVLVRSIASPEMVPSGTDQPKAADFIGWIELIANAIAPGPHASEIRGYIKSLARSTWQLVGWLTHSANAVRYEGDIVLSATQEVLNAIGAALVRHERNNTDRCPHCGSLKIATMYKPAEELEEVILCESCGWTSDQPGS